MLDGTFIQTAQRHFNPYRGTSGTEHVAFLLYSLARMTRPRVVVEYGSGYTTLFLLRALAENAEDFGEERSHLAGKSSRFIASQSARLGLKENGDPARWDEEATSSFWRWFGEGGKACGVDPNFYRSDYAPHLFSFEQLPDNHDYVRALDSAVHEIGHGTLFTHLTNQAPSHAALPAHAHTIDWAWNDHDGYRDFFREFWPHLNPAGGLFIFHNVPAVPAWIDAVEWMKAERAAAGDLEVLILEEPHKLNQNGCAILRRTTNYRPRVALANPLSIWQSTRAFTNDEREKR